MSVRERMMSPAIWIDDPTEANHCKTGPASGVAVSRDNGKDVQTKHVRCASGHQ